MAIMVGMLSAQYVRNMCLFVEQKQRQQHRAHKYVYDNTCSTLPHFSMFGEEELQDREKKKRRGANGKSAPVAMVVSMPSAAQAMPYMDASEKLT